MARGDELTLTTEEGRVVDGKEHRHRRLVNGNGRQRLGVLDVADGVANLKLLESDDGTDVAAVYLLNALVAHTVEGMQFLDFRLLHRTVAVGDRHLLTVLQLAAMDAPHGDTARIAAIVQRGDEHLRCTLNLLRCGDDLDNLVKQIGDVSGRLLPVLAHPAVLGRTVDDGEVKLVFGGVQREHQVEHHLVDLLGTAVGLVYLVDNDNRLEADLQRLLKHEARLRHRSLEGVDEQQAAIGHVEHALNLATEVGVSRSVDNIDFRSFPVDTHILRENSDASLTLEVIGVQYLARQVLSLAEEVSCQHHLVHERRLAVVYVSNNCNIPDVLHTSFC